MVRRGTGWKTTEPHRSPPSRTSTARSWTSCRRCWPCDVQPRRRVHREDDGARPDRAAADPPGDPGRAGQDRRDPSQDRPGPHRGAGAEPATGKPAGHQDPPNEGEALMRVNRKIEVTLDRTSVKVG